MIFTYCYLDLPTLPNEIISQAYDAYEKKEKTSFYNPNLLITPGFDQWRDRKVRYKDGQILQNTPSYRYWISKEFEDWVKSYIQPEVQGSGINVFENGNFIAPHADNSRNFSIHYLLESGGMAETIWYREKGKPVERPDLKNNYDPKSFITDYEQIEEIDRVLIKERSWICLNGSILHAVENLTGKRLAIQISSDTPPDNIKKTYISQIALS